MIKQSTLAVLAIALIASPALAVETAPPPAKAPYVVNLPVELKDPYLAYNLGLVPFQAGAAAAYVGTTRLTYLVRDDLQQSAGSQNLVDFLLLGGAVGLLLARDTGNLGTIGALCLVGTSVMLHSAFHAPFWGEQAVIFNQEHMGSAGFDVKPTPKAE